MAHNSTTIDMVRAVVSTAPPSFNGDGQLYALNLFLATAIMSLGIMLTGRFVHALWVSRKVDKLRHPVTMHRLKWLCCCVAVTMRTGAESASMLSWSPHDPVLTARMLMLKRWIDPASSLFTFGWMALLVLTWTAVEGQLRRHPLPVKIWASADRLRRPALVVVVAAVMAVGVVWARG